MDGNIWSILDVIFVGAGIYVLYAWVILKTKGEVTTSILMNKDVDLRKCKDLEGYKVYIAPRMLVFGIACLLYGASGLINSYVTPLPAIIYSGAMVLFLIVLIWFGMTTKKGVQRFW